MQLPLPIESEKEAIIRKAVRLLYATPARRDKLLGGLGQLLRGVVRRLGRLEVHHGSVLGDVDGEAELPKAGDLAEFQSRFNPPL